MSNNIKFIKIWEGDKNNTIIDAIQINNNCPIKKFQEKELTDEEYRRLYTLFELLDDRRGRIINPQKFKKLHFVCDSCFELKPTKQVRISFIYLKRSDKHICLLDGFRKKQNRWPRREIEKTEKLCKEARKYEYNRGGINV